MDTSADNKTTSNTSLKINNQRWQLRNIFHQLITLFFHCPSSTVFTLGPCKNWNCRFIALYWQRKANHTKKRKSNKIDRDKVWWTDCDNAFCCSIGVKLPGDDPVRQGEPRIRIWTSFTWTSSWPNLSGVWQVIVCAAYLRLCVTALSADWCCRRRLYFVACAAGNYASSQVSFGH